MPFVKTTGVAVVSVSPVFVAVAGWLITRLVPSVMLRICVPLGIPVPLIYIPAARPVVLVTETVVCPLVVPPPATLPTPTLLVLK